jgi:hypothetical protein
MNLTDFITFPLNSILLLLSSLLLPLALVSLVLVLPLSNLCSAGTKIFWLSPAAREETGAWALKKIMLSMMLSLRGKGRQGGRGES